MKIKWKYHRELPSRPKKVIVKRESDGNYFVIFSVELEKEELPKTGKKCGIDLNIDNIAVADSTGKIYLKTIKKLSKYDKKYMKIQKKLSKRYEEKNYSKNTKKLQKQQNKIHKKVRNVKDNFFHQFSKFLVENFDSIRAEKLEKKKMKEAAPSKQLRRSIAEVSWDSLIQKLKYKTERYGKVFEEINPAYTSQRCNRCGYIHKSNRTSQSKFHCKKCGYKANADCNAAKNILEYESWLLEQKALWAVRHAESS
jgi:putative transposase